MSTAEQSGLEILFSNGKIRAITLIRLYTCSIQQDDPGKTMFGGKHCFPGVAENEYSRTALAYSHV